MKRAIVTTTINDVTEAINIYDRMEDWTIIVAGDLKTPKDYALTRGIYLSPRDQEDIDKDLSELIGWNCIQRRNFALLHAYKLGVDYVCMIDDDNIPLSNWGKNIYLDIDTLLKEYDVTDICFDPIGATNYPHLWHRGFPLELISTRDYRSAREKSVKPSIQANFWNGDPDIDAICRMEHRPDCNFNLECFPFTSNAIAPFNSQNTLITREVMQDYFLYPHIGRMDDIWASFYVQALGHKVIFAEPTVLQVRNPHDLVEDMKREYLGYEKNSKLLKSIYANPDSISEYLPSRTNDAWQRYRELMNSI